MQRNRSIDADLALQARRRLKAVLGRRTVDDRLGTGPDADLDDADLDDADLDDAGLDDEETGSDEVDELHPVPRRVVAGPRRFDRTHLTVVAVLALVGLLVTAVLVLRARPVTMAAPITIPTVTASGTQGSLLPAPSTAPSGSSSSGGSASTSPPAVVIHVAGAVRRPGVVRLAAGARVADAIAASGGLTSRAVPGELNLAQPLVDGQQVLIVTRAASEHDPPEVSEVRQPGAEGAGTAPGATAGPSSATGAPLDLNAATEADLDELPGVGPVTAGAILAWREQHGRFSAVAELQEVDGIGPKTYADLAPLVRV